MKKYLKFLFLVSIYKKIAEKIFPAVFIKNILGKHFYKNFQKIYSDKIFK